MATGNISKQKGFTGPRGATGPQGPKGDDGNFSNVRLNYNEETGELSYQTELVPSTTTAPYIGKNGNWYVYDGVRKKYVDSGVSSQGSVSDEFVKEYLDEKTAVLKSDIEGLQKRINEEAHFRGYLSTNAKIQALTATPNDFAYSAESNTKWVYDAEKGWQNTGVAVPDQLTPASETTPLINGVASVGEEEAYARGDHRHPTDTTRASVGELNEAIGSLRTEIKSAEPLYVQVINNDQYHQGDKSWKEVLNAYKAGRCIIVELFDEMYSGYGRYHLTALGLDQTFIFTGIRYDTNTFEGDFIGYISQMELYADDDWRRKDIRMITQKDRATEILAVATDNDSYPTTKAVVDYVKEYVKEKAEPFVIEATYNYASDTVITDATFTDIQQAITDGKNVVLHLSIVPNDSTIVLGNEKNILPIVFFSDYDAIFAIAQSNKIYTISCDIKGNWNFEEATIEKPQSPIWDMVDSVSGNSIPTAYSVKSYVNSAIGEALEGDY